MAGRRTRLLEPRFDKSSGASGKKAPARIFCANIPATNDHLSSARKEVVASANQAVTDQAAKSSND
jgi:hypothetical protein